MPILFLLLALGVLAAIALVAAGRGDGLPEAEPDVAPVALPAGPLAAGDLTAVRFPSALRGYRMADVDAVLDRLAAELALRDARIAQLEGPAPGGEPEPAQEPRTPGRHERDAAEPGVG